MSSTSLTYDVEVRMHAPKALPVKWGLWKQRFCVVAPRQVGFFSRAIQCPKDLSHSEPDTIILCDGVEPIVEDIRIVTLRKDGQLLAWLKFVDVAARNAFILAARPLIRSPELNAIPWARTRSKKLTRTTLDDMFAGYCSPKYGKKSKNISIMAYLSNLSWVRDAQAITTEFTVDFKPGCCGMRCAINGRVTFVANGGQASIAGVEVGMKVVKINGEQFQDTLDMGEHGGLEAWIDGEATYQEKPYQVTYEYKTWPKTAEAGEEAKTNDMPPMMRAFRNGLQKLRCGMVQSETAEKCSDSKSRSRRSTNSIYHGPSSSSTTCGDDSRSDLFHRTPLNYVLCSFGLSEAASESFTVSESSFDGASVRAMTDVSSNVGSPTQSICEMYDDMEHLGEDLCAMYDHLDIENSISVADDKFQFDSADISRSFDISPTDDL